MNAAEKRLFASGDGALPPTLAGREQEQAALSRCLADLTGGSSPPHNLVLTGPCGSGKTVPQKPVAALVDEAHRLDLGVGQLLLSLLSFTGKLCRIGIANTFSEHGINRGELHVCTVTA